MAGDWPYLGLHDADGNPLLVLTSDPDTDPLFVTKLDLGSPEVVEDLAPDPAGDGVRDSTKHIGSRGITVELTALGNEQGDYRYWLEQLSALCHPSKRLYMHIQPVEWDEPWRILVRGAAWPGDFTDVQPDVQFQWKAPEGVLESVEEKVAVLQPSGGLEPGIHEPFSAPLSIPAGYGSPGPVTVGGVLPTWPTIDVYGLWRDAKLTSPGGQTVFSGLTIQDSQFARIDMRNRKITSGSDTSTSLLGYRVFGASSWWQLQPGSNLINFTAATLGAGAQAVIRWRERKP